MKSLNYIVFYGIFFLLYGAVNLYIGLRGWQCLAYFPHYRTVYVAVFLVSALSFIVARILENYWISPLSTALAWIGSFWFAAMLYFICAIVLFDLLRVVNHIFGIFPEVVRTHYDFSKLVAASVVFGVVGITLIAGFINACMPRVRAMEFTIDKHVSGPPDLRIVAASDIHLGTIIGRNRFDRIVDMINGLSPDVILLPGDIVDEDLAPVIKANLGESLRRLSAPYGVFAVTGNHEYIGGVEPAVRYLVDHGVVMLRDSSVRLENGAVLVGREDRSMSQFSDNRRKALKELVAGIDRSAPLILMDHQPFGLEEGVENGIDLQLSGHTHHGQLWPLNYITRAIYQVSWGYVKLGETHVYVSCGVGTWGPPVRTGNRPEILDITLHFTGVPPQ
jgi:predicted MPP superfamily phosphohydrolase